MITVSLIQDYLYCPLIVYIKENNASNLLTPTNLEGKISHEALIGFEELIKRNLWALNSEMQVKEILEELLKDVPEFLETIYHQYKDEFDDYDTKIIFDKLKDDLKFNTWLIAIKSQKLLKTGRTGKGVVDTLFPPCLIEFRIEDSQGGLLGKVDKIEIIDGVYYPIKIKTGLPPLKGVWHSDAMQITAYALLMEHEFNKEVPVGFINYMRVGSKKPVLINSSLREKFSEVFNELISIIYNDEIPEVVQNDKKCRACNYSELCDYRIA
jgi:CRISPR-associated exonuclease Cas4